MAAISLGLNVLTQHAGTKPVGCFIVAVAAPDEKYIYVYGIFFMEMFEFRIKFQWNMSLVSNWWYVNTGLV